MKHKPTDAVLRRRPRKADICFARGNDNTDTIVDHTSLATGTVPGAHGMVAYAGSSMALCSDNLPNTLMTRSVTPYDIAPTLASRLGMKPPSGAIGVPLEEVLEQ